MFVLVLLIASSDLWSSFLQKDARPTVLISLVTSATDSPDSGVYGIRFSLDSFHFAMSSFSSLVWSRASCRPSSKISSPG